MRVTLHSQSVVAGALFTVAEIAVVEGSEALGALRIGRSPRAGTTLALRRAEVEQAILRLRPELRGRLRVGGAETLAVRRGPLQTIEYARVREEAAAALRAFLRERFARFEVETLAQDPGPLAVPPGRLEIRPRIASAGPVPTRLSVWTDVYVDGRHYQSVPVPFGVRAWLPALAARGPQRAGERLRAASFAVREEQVAGMTEVPVPAQSDLASLRLKRPLAAGEILAWSHVERAPLVGRNEEIRVQLSQGAIALETSGTAVQDGRPGEVIRVRAAGSRETFPARVVAAGTVEALWK